MPDSHNMKSEARQLVEHAVAQLAAIAKHISRDSPIHAEQPTDRLVARVEQARHYPERVRGP